MKFRDYLNDRLATDPEFRDEYEKLAPEFEFIRSVIEARLNAGLSQKELAERIGTSQSAIARLEGGGGLPSTRTLLKLAAALNVEFHITPDQVVRAEPLSAAS